VSYREFRVLIALALDARDETRQGMPGHALLARRGNCAVRSVRRALASLEERGVIKALSRPAPGRRTVYEITAALATAANMVATVTAATSEPTAARSGGNGGQHGGHPLVNGPSHRPKSSSAREQQSRLTLMPDPAADQMMIIEILKNYRPAEAAKLTAEDAGRVLDELRRRSREPITTLRTYANTCISRDPDQWLRIANGLPASDDDDWTRGGCSGYPWVGIRAVSPWTPHT
jgi:DNA-binding MarR family transcriptional regulator